MTGDQSVVLHMIEYCDLAMFRTYGYLVENASTFLRLLGITLGCQDIFLSNMKGTDSLSQISHGFSQF